MIRTFPKTKSDHFGPTRSIPVFPYICIIIHAYLYQDSLHLQQLFYYKLSYYEKTNSILDTIFANIYLYCYMYRMFKKL